MKKYIIPEMKLSRFEIEDIVTLSGAQPTAMEQALTAAAGAEGKLHTFSINVQ